MCMYTRVHEAHDLAHLAEAKDTLLDAVDAPANSLVLEGGNASHCCLHGLFHALRVIWLPQAVEHLLLEHLQASRTVYQCCREHEVTGRFWALCGSDEHAIKRPPLFPL